MSGMHSPPPKDNKDYGQIFSALIRGILSPLGVIGGVLLVLVIVMSDGADIELVVPYLLICGFVGASRSGAGGRDPYDVDPSDPYD